MSFLLPRTAYAEDQRLSHTILTVHVIHRGIQAGAVLSPLVSLPRRYFSKTKPTSPVAASLIRGAGTGSLIGGGLMGLAVVGRMWGREEIEWKDRSWRLLENKGQVEVDDWSLIGTAGGLAAAASGVKVGNVAVRPTGWRGVLGMTVVGNLVGVAGYMGWRHGIKGGKWEE